MDYGMMMMGDGWIHLLIGLIVTVLVLKFIIGVVFMTKNKREENNDYGDKGLNKKNNIERYRQAGLSDSDIKIFRENLAEAKSNIQTWEKNLKKDDDLQVVESVTGGLEASKQTFKYIVQNPKELTKQNDFLYKNLPNMVKLTEKFLEMKGQKGSAPEFSRDLDETLLLIKTLSANISKHYHEILMEDVNVIKQEVRFDD